MLRNSETYRDSRGFTLTELLVAMAIFVTLMGSLITLFSGTVDTTRAGYTRLATFEQGRTIVEVMKRDLATAFTARDSGDVQQFYGQENAFTLVGANEFGQLSRISYAVVRIDNRHDFVGSFAEELGVLVRRTMTQGAKHGAASTPFSPPSPITGVVLAQNLVSALADRGELPMPVALNAYNTLEGARDALINGTPLPPGFPDGPFLGFGVDDFIVDVEVIFQQAHLLRYEESARSDLEAFQLPGDANSPGAIINGWPRLNPALFDLAEEFPNTGEALDTLYYAQLAALNPTLDDSFGSDLRDWMPNYQYITPATIESILSANRRKIWLDFLSNTPRPINESDLNTLSYWRVPEAEGQPPVVWDPINNPNEPRLNPLDYVVAEHFLYRVVLRGSGAATYPDIGTGAAIALFDNDGNPVDLYGNPPFFSYAQGRDNSDGHFLETFNANSNILGYKNMVRAVQADSVNTAGYMLGFDENLRSAHTGYKNPVALQGSPLAPRIPSLIKVQFWVAKRGVRPGAAPVQRWFTEVVDVPTGMTRRAPRTIAVAGL